ncbi:MAG: sigma-70 family RNA polymerase sigma factor [Gemmataceae bacterium]|nr:sigma-70 family RNA polymerase sigma factor [Gemmataceae bacterium]
MSSNAKPGKKPARPVGVPYHVAHESFTSADAERDLGPRASLPDEFAGSHMPDDTTRDFAKRMHYAAWRAAMARDDKRRGFWRSAYLSFRDRVVLGNRKLIYRAVRRWSASPERADDLIGDCQVVLIQAVAAYNPWLGVRFSTYAVTCLMRALSRLSQKHAADKLGRSLPLESLPDGEPRDAESEDTGGRPARIDEYFREGSDLLSDREKSVLVRRFSLDESAKAGTLEEVGRELGLSKERVRQVQASALEKLRAALGAR